MSVFSWYILISITVIVLAGFTKGVTGLGAPVIATPILALLYNNLPLAIAVMIVPTVLTDILSLVRFSGYWRHSVQLIPFMAFGLIGILVGTTLLVTVDQRVLRALLGLVILAFVFMSWFQLLPTFSQSVVRLASPIFGCAAGALQGSAGVSSPVITMYLFNLGISREVFLFSINSIFAILDITQVIALEHIGLYSSSLLGLAALSAIPLCFGLVAGFRAHKHINDLIFRKGVLILLVIIAIGLLGRAIA